MKSKRGIIILAISLIAILCTIWLVRRYFIYKQANVIAESKLFIPSGSQIYDVYNNISPLLIHPERFIKAATGKGYKKVYPGRYTIKIGESNQDILERLIQGKQDEIELMIGNYASIYELANKVDTFLEIDAETIIKAITKRPESQGKDSLQMIYFLTPNTYRFHWTVTPEAFVEKIADQYHKFWNAENKELLKASGLSEFEAVTLASIVQLESYRLDEQPKVAGLYLNRLKKGMKLDADPTVIFSKKIQAGWHTKFNRVYFNDLKQMSDYNTYRNAGLPPGPICMPNTSAIAAVLKPEKHDYIFFVADPNKPGYHLYSNNYEEHQRNAKLYRQWANENNIK